MPDGVPFIDPDIVAGRIAALLQDRRNGAVKPLLAALEKLAPEHKDLALLRVSYCCQTGDVAQALQLLGDAITRDPGNPILYVRRAEILFGQADYAGAAANAAEAIVMAPRGDRAKAVLGLALLQLGQFDSALACLAESFAADPAGVDVALALAALAPENAIAVLHTAIAATPHLAVLRNALTRRYLCKGDFAQAGRNAEQTRSLGLADAETFCLSAFAQMQEENWDTAATSATQAQSLAPGNPWGSRLAAALGQRGSGELASIPQQNALAAEQALVAGGTILPGTFRSLLEESQLTGPVLDLYCGTGLNAIAAQDICAGPWMGAEPDPVLRSLCAERGLYARLEPHSQFSVGVRYPIILLNEVFAYSAALQPRFTELRAALAPGGMALAAIPTGRPGLTGHALFAHSAVHVAEQAAQAGFGCRVARSGILRHIEGIPLYGIVASFQRL